MEEKPQVSPLIRRGQSVGKQFPIREQYREGQSLIEVVIAMGIFAIIMSTVFVLFFGGRSISTDALTASRAADYARNGMEGVRSLRDKSWFDLTDGTHGLVYSSNAWQFLGTSDIQSEFTREVIVSTVSPDVKKIQVHVTWQTNHTEQVDIVTNLTNWQNVQGSGGGGGGDTGGSGPSGDWMNPVTLGSVDLGPGEQATDLDVKNKIVFMTALASASAKPDFFVVNAANGSSPVLLASINTGTGLNGVDVGGNYAYVVGPDNASEFMVIDISNLASPQKIGSLDLPGTQDGLSVFYWGGYAYVGRASGATQEFVVIDVTTPSNPQVVSGLSGVGGQVNDIVVFNQRAYLGTEDASRGMIVVDVSNPTAPAVLGSLNLGKQVYSVYLTRESRVAVGGSDRFYMVDASNSASITTLGSVAIGYKTRDIYVAGSLAFLGTDDSNKEFQVWDVSNPAAIAFWSSFNFPQVATGVDYENNLVYVSVRSNDALRIITSP